MTNTMRCHALAAEFRRNELGLLAFANSLLSAFGAASPAGRLVDRILNSHARFALEEFTGTFYRPPDQTEVASSAAEVMRLHAIRRPTARRIPLPEATSRAANDYAAERIALLEEIEAITRDRFVRRELRDWRKLAALITRKDQP